MPDIHPAAAIAIALEVILPSKTNPRTHFPASDLAEMEASIRKHGVFQPLLLRVHPTKSGHYEIVDGERRFRGAKQAGLSEVPAAVGTFSDEQAMEMQIVSFLSRKDLTPLEEARCYNTMLTKRYTHERIAEKVGRSIQYVRDRCRLLDLVKGAEELLEQGRIDVGHAILLARLAPEHQIRTIQEPKAGAYGPERHSGLWQAQRDLPGTSEGVTGDREELKAVSVRELAAWIQDHVRLEPVAAAAQTADLFPDVAEVVAASQASGPGLKPLKFVEITTSHMLNDDTRDPKRRVLGQKSWVRADGLAGSKTCANGIAGIIVAGDGEGEAFKVCTDKKNCQVHWKAEITARAKRERAVEKSGRTGEDRYALEEKKRKEAEAKEAAEEKRFEAARPALLRALADQIKTMPVKATGQIAALVAKAVRSTYHHHSELAKIVPAGKTVEDLLRHLAFIVAGSHAFGWKARGSFANLAKAFGVDTEKLLAAQAAAIVEKCRVCACTAKKPCQVKVDGRRETCYMAEPPGFGSSLYLCSACAARTGQTAKPKAKK